MQKKPQEKEEEVLKVSRQSRVRDRQQEWGAALTAHSFRAR